MNRISQWLKLLVGMMVLVSPLAISSALSLSASSSPIAQAAPRCVEDSIYEPASDTTRTVKIPEFGIEVDIPENYRTLKRQSGAIEILHPDDYQFITCIVSGGEGLGHGYYSDYIAVVEFGAAADRIRQMVANGADVTPYNQGVFSGRIIATPARRGIANASFLGTIGESDRLFNIYPSCDCDTNTADLTRLMARIRPLR
jgi:hypothetical protein